MRIRSPSLQASRAYKVALPHKQQRDSALRVSKTSNKAIPNRSDIWGLLSKLIWATGRMLRAKFVPKMPKKNVRVCHNHPDSVKHSDHWHCCDTDRSDKATPCTCIVIDASEAKGNPLFGSIYHTRPWPAQEEVTRISDVQNPGNSSGMTVLSYAKGINHLHTVTILWSLSGCCWCQYREVKIRMRSITSVCFAFCTTLAVLGPPVPPKLPMHIIYVGSERQLNESTWMTYRLHGF